ncbi:MAG: hypothetical protein ACR2RF_28550 [Geminicoccaceae bacterium]
MVCEKALEAAIDEFFRVRPHEVSTEDLLRNVLEAYDAARWRPIEEARREGNTGPWVLVHWYAADPIGNVGTFSLMFWASSMNRWCVAGGGETFTHLHLANRKAMFRTIDPPTQHETPDQTKDDPHA